MKKKAIVIGSGFGGLAIAVRLQARGYDVTVIEKNAKLGGHAYQFKKDGYTFDMGPSLITAPFIIENIFRAANKELKDYIELMPLDPFYRIYFHDKTFIDYSGHSEKMKEQMAKFNSDDASKYEEFINFSEKVYNAVIVEGLGSTPFNKLSTMLKFAPSAMKIRAFDSSYKVAARFFQDFRHRFMFSFHPLFIGGNPFRVPAIYLMISYLEKAGGIWFTKGGMYSLVEALTKLFTDIGGNYITNSPVTEIKVENGRTTGVVANETFYPADLVVSNADLTHTYKDLIDESHRNKWKDSKFDKVKYSMGTFLLYLGVKKKYPQLLHHTLILSPRYKELVEDIFDNKILPDDFSMYLHVPSRTDPDMAPEGSESIYVLIPTTNLQGNVTWDKMKRIYSNKIINFLEAEFDMVDLRENIEVEVAYTPEDFHKNRNSAHGSPWGFEPTLTQSAWFRPHNRSEDIPNLYFTGAGTHPGAGIPGVMLSAEATERLIVEDFNQ